MEMHEEALRETVLAKVLSLSSAKEARASVALLAFAGELFAGTATYLNPWQLLVPGMALIENIGARVEEDRFLSKQDIIAQGLR